MLNNSAQLVWRQTLCNKSYITPKIFKFVSEHGKERFIVALGLGMLEPVKFLILLQVKSVVLQQLEILQCACCVESPVFNAGIPSSFTTAPASTFQCKPDIKTWVKSRALTWLWKTCLESEEAWANMISLNYTLLFHPLHHRTNQRVMSQLAHTLIGHDCCCNTVDWLPYYRSRG